MRFLSMLCGLDLHSFRLFPAIVGLFSIASGLTFIMRPKTAIESQIAFYRRINWKMEPVSWEKEITTTKIIGVLTVLLGVLALAMTALPLHFS